MTTPPVIIDFNTPLSELNFSRAYKTFFERKKFDRVSDILSTPPKRVLLFKFKIDNLSDFFYEHIGLVVSINKIISEPNKNFIFLMGLDMNGNKMKILTFEKSKWGNILNSLLKNKKQVKMFVEGILKPPSLIEGNEIEYFLDARFLELYSEKQKPVLMYYSNLTDNEKMIVSTQKLLKLLRLNTFIAKTELFQQIEGLHNVNDQSSLEHFADLYVQNAILTFFVKRDQSLSNLLTSPEDLKTYEINYKPNKNLEFELNASQIKAINSICSLYRQSKPSLLYIIGEVASGKSIIAYESIRTAIEQKVRRIILLAPTVILASQHYTEFIQRYPHLYSETALVTGNTNRNPTDTINKKILIGTHALFSYKNLETDMVFIDEPQMFGIKQQKFSNGKTRYVFLTATPLPMWTSLLISDKIDSVTIENRKRNVTKVPLIYTENKLKHLLSILPQEKQTLIVAPRIASEVGTYPSLSKIEEILKETKRPYISIHGKMNSKDILENLNKFRNKEITTLLSTSMVESGLNIPSLKYLIVVGAETYGLLGLYQISGRAGRGGDAEQAFVYLFSKNQKFLSDFVSINDGYSAAKLDLKNRGSGKIYNEEQSGMIKIPFGERVNNVLIKNATEKYKNFQENNNLIQIYTDFFQRFI